MSQSPRRHPWQADCQWLTGEGVGEEAERADRRGGDRSSPPRRVEFPTIGSFKISRGHRERTADIRPARTEHPPAGLMKYKFAEISLRSVPSILDAPPPVRAEDVLHIRWALSRDVVLDQLVAEAVKEIAADLFSAIRRDEEVRSVQRTGATNAAVEMNAAAICARSQTMSDCNPEACEDEARATRGD